MNWMCQIVVLNVPNHCWKTDMNYFIAVQRPQKTKKSVLAFAAETSYTLRSTFTHCSLPPSKRQQLLKLHWFTYNGFLRTMVAKVGRHVGLESANIQLELCFNRCKPLPFHIVTPRLLSWSTRPANDDWASDTVERFEIHEYWPL